MTWVIGCLIALGLLLIWIRVAPSDVGRWHQLPEDVTNEDLSTGAMRVIAVGAEGLVQLDAIIRATRGTRVLAGSRDEGMITYVSRSVWFGFPDYTTVGQTAGKLAIYGRARFGLSDMGVNAGRIDGWLGALAQ